MSWCGFLWVYPVWTSLNLESVGLHLLPKLGSFQLFKCYHASPQFPLSCSSSEWTSDLLSQTRRWLTLCSFSPLNSLCCSDWANSIALVTTSRIPPLHSRPVFSPMDLWPNHIFILACLFYTLGHNPVWLVVLYSWFFFILYTLWCADIFFFFLIFLAEERLPLRH